MKVKENLNVLYGLIQRYYFELKESLVNGSTLEGQQMNRELLNRAIRNYLLNGGKRDISNYCRYYV